MAALILRLASILPVVLAEQAEPLMAQLRGANTSRVLGFAPMSASCTCSEGFPHCSWLDHKCYLGQHSFSHSQQCLGTCTHNGPMPQAADFVLERIRNDEVEKEMAYAKTGSSMPEMFHGIWWMDQFCYNVDATKESDPGYAQVCNFKQRVPEMLLSWGEGEWDAESRCTGRIYQNGGARGHWTFNDMGKGLGGSTVWTSNACLGGPQWSFLQFCCADKNDKDCLSLDVGVYFESKFLNTITSLMRFSMVKKPWGWDRVTKDFAGGLLVEYHYPVFQIVDGSGVRTSDYGAYLEWASPVRKPECSCCGGCKCSCSGAGNLSCGWNTPEVPGTSLIGRLRAP